MSGHNRLLFFAVIVFALFIASLLNGGVVIATQDETLPAECLVSGTMVPTPDGLKPVEDIEVGDEVLGESGVNTVIGLYNVELGDQPLYSINGGEAFVTEPHPFLTTDGWKAFDPEAAKLWNPDLEISRLEVGDVLITDSGNQIVHSIDMHSAPADTPIYNFAVAGDQTYYADGYLVHNKGGDVECSTSVDCDDGEGCCDNSCVNTDTNDNHCGSCYDSCEDCYECTDGSCSSACEAGEHCSSSGNCVECTEDSHCTDGYCSSNECKPCDSDGDGYDSPQCGGSDCDDDDEDVYPGADEVCDGFDNDCDGDVDEGVGYCHEGDPDCTGFVDCDSYDGDSCPTSSGCEVHQGECTVCKHGYVGDDGECNMYQGDTDYHCTTYGVENSAECSDAIENCDFDCGCSGSYDAYDDGSRCAGFAYCDSSDCEDGITGCSYDDVGDCSSNDDRSSCESSSGCAWSCCVSNYGDSCSTDKGVCTSGTIQCDGSCSGSYATESPESSCDDGLDNDCDGKTDCDDSECADASACTVTCHRDSDGDGYGDPDVTDTFTADSCSEISGWVSDSSDCNDNSDCLAPGRVWYHDADGDGYVSETDTKTQCSWPGNGWYARADACADE